MEKQRYTVTETTVFKKQADKLFSEKERQNIAVELSENPELGALIQGTGGARKVRVAMQGRGKSGGARVIYVFISEDNEIYLLAVYKKGAKGNLTAAEKALLKKVIEVL